MRVRYSIALGVLALGACGPKFKESNYGDPRSLAIGAIDAARAGNCGGTVPILRRVLFELPPRDTLLPSLRSTLAECHLDNGEYLEASRQFRRVADDFPQHDLAGMALVRAGDALSKLWRRPELDPTYGQNAIATYVEALNRYPGGEAADSARTRIAGLSEEFAEKDYKTAEHYFRIKAYDSAIIYYREVVRNYNQTRFAPLAMLRLVEIFDRLGYADERGEACTYLHRFHPDVEGVSEACPSS